MSQHRLEMGLIKECRKLQSLALVCTIGISTPKMQSLCSRCVASEFSTKMDLSSVCKYLYIDFEQLYYVVQMFYILAKVMVKASIALLIDRIFPIRWMRRATICFIVLLITHNLVFLFLIIFQCKPISSIWDKHITGSCLNLTAIAYAGASLSIVEYIVLILLPIPELWKLKAKLGRRIQLIFVFTLASL